MSNFLEQAKKQDASINNNESLAARFNNQANEDKKQKMTRRQFAITLPEYMIDKLKVYKEREVNLLELIEEAICQIVDHYEKNNQPLTNHEIVWPSEVFTGRAAQCKKVAKDTEKMLNKKSRVKS